MGLDFYGYREAFRVWRANGYFVYTSWFFVQFCTFQMLFITAAVAIGLPALTFLLLFVFLGAWTWWGFYCMMCKRQSKLRFQGGRPRPVLFALTWRQELALWKKQGYVVAFSGRPSGVVFVALNGVLFFGLSSAVAHYHDVYSLFITDLMVVCGVFLMGLGAVGFHYLLTKQNSKKAWIEREQAFALLESGPSP